MKKILFFILAICLVMGCSKNDEKTSEKVTLTIKLPYNKNAEFTPVYLFYRNSETEKILNNNDFEFNFNQEAYVNVKENTAIKYHDKQNVNSEGVVVFHNVPKDYAQIVFRMSFLGFNTEVAELLNLKEKTNYDFTKK